MRSAQISNQLWKMLSKISRKIIKFIQKDWWSTEMESVRAKKLPCSNKKCHRSGTQSRNVVKEWKIQRLFFLWWINESRPNTSSPKETNSQSHNRVHWLTMKSPRVDSTISLSFQPTAAKVFQLLPIIQYFWMKCNKIPKPFKNWATSLPISTTTSVAQSRLQLR